MKTSARLYSCCRCHAQVIICRKCDRGQRYCTKGCRVKARRKSLQRAGKKYQSSRAGCFNNARRQQRFRDRQKQKVTHQCSSETPVHAVLTPTAKRQNTIKSLTKHTLILICHHCKSVCGPFLRHDFLDHTRFKRPFRRRSR